MPYNPNLHANAGYISKESSRKLDLIRIRPDRKFTKRAMLEYLIDIEYERWQKEQKDGI